MKQPFTHHVFLNNTVFCIGGFQAFCVVSVVNLGLGKWFHFNSNTSFIVIFIIASPYTLAKCRICLPSEWFVLVMLVHVYMCMSDMTREVGDRFLGQIHLFQYWIKQAKFSQGKWGTKSGSGNGQPNKSSTTAATTTTITAQNQGNCRYNRK